MECEKQPLIKICNEIIGDVNFSKKKSSIYFGVLSWVPMSFVYAPALEAHLICIFDVYLFLYIIFLLKPSSRA